MNNESSSSYSCGLYIRVPVQLIDERTDPDDPRDELGAFLWLVTHASRSERPTRTKRGEIQLRRGEVIAAAAHLAKEWRWSRKRVRNYFARLVRMGRLRPGPPTRHRPATFFIVNFDAYQGAGATRSEVGATIGATKGPPAGHLGATPLDERDSKDKKEDADARESTPRKDALGRLIEGPEADVIFERGRLTLVNGERARWLELFDGDEQGLDLALTQAAAYVQPNSQKSLLVQVSSQLAHILRDMRDRDRRYARGKPSGTKPAGQRPAARKGLRTLIIGEQGGRA